MMTEPPGLARRFAVRTRRVVSFVAYFGYEFILSNLEVLWEILTPRGRSAPAIIAVPLRCRTRMEIVTMANLIALTPGTLTLEIALDPPTLYVHGMFAGDPAAFMEALHQLEDRLLNAMRPVGAGRATADPVDRRWLG